MEFSTETHQEHISDGEGVKNEWLVSLTYIHTVQTHNAMFFRLFPNFSPTGRTTNIHPFIIRVTGGDGAYPSSHQGRGRKFLFNVLTCKKYSLTAAARPAYRISLMFLTQKEKLWNMFRNKNSFCTTDSNPLRSKWFRNRLFVPASKNADVQCIKALLHNNSGEKVYLHQDVTMLYVLQTYRTADEFKPSGRVVQWNHFSHFFIHHCICLIFVPNLNGFILSLSYSMKRGVSP